MKALFVEPDHDRRMILHELARAAGIDHQVAGNAHEAFALLAAHAGEVEVIATALDLPGVDAEHFARALRGGFPSVTLFGHGEPEALHRGELFDRIFFRPHGDAALVRAVGGVVGSRSERDLLRDVFSAA